MADTVSIRSLQERLEQVVSIRGWLYGKRSGGRIAFLLVRDGTGLCQCVVEAAQAELFSAAESLGQESSLMVTGRVRADSRSPGGAELAVTGLQVLQSASDYPISRKAHGTDFLMEHRHLWLRSPRQAAILRVRHTLIRAARRYFDDHGFTLVDTPILSPGAAEGAGTLFPVDYFGDTVYLAQTGQLYLEAAAMALGRVYCFGPTFRAEKSKTRRHLAEFWMIEPEIAFAELPELMTWAEGLVCAMVGAALSERREELALLGRNPAALERIAPPFPRLTYSQAVDLLRDPALHRKLEQELEADRARLKTLIPELAALDEQLSRARQGWQQDKLAQQAADLRERIRDLEAQVAQRPIHIEHARNFAWGEDFGGDEETIISRQFDRPVLITEYPRRIKAFYMKPSPANPDVVLNLDMLAPEGYGEIIGGSQREDDLAALRQRMAEEGMNPAPYEWYLDLRRYGSVPHGGFGLGLERTVAWICGLKHIRETIPFPRLMGRIYP
ncbi:MAG TPA: asparagine--tRNA ligase [Kiritimatiellia bacterium]|nr:asparagine--tRNA ligase [Kiritimatiellia bacterium]HRZ11570.1 asparagine--tRNA ligase [Kiritimatiellia bacterium]HSA16879.1 asparagine--tRNA ligase [Kiritimatiellia bacterium]